MNVSVLLRILPASRTGGRLAGRAELIETGETRVFADHDEMLVFLRQVAGTPPAADPDHDGGCPGCAVGDHGRDGTQP